MNKNFHHPTAPARGRSAVPFALICFLSAFLLVMGGIRQEQEALAERLAPGVLRFHILADSDKRCDQQIKLEVRSLLLDYIHKHLGDDAGKDGTVRWLTAHRTELERTATRYLADRGFPYGARLELTNCYFPARAYGELTFPCGYYDAARVILGRGNGHNWWCVLYPRMCFVDAACSVPGESLELLKQKINQDDYLSLKDNRPDLMIRFRLLPGFSVLLPAAATPPSQSP